MRIGIPNRLLASQGQRFAHLIIDWITFYLSILALSFIVALVAEIAGLDDVIIWLATLDQIDRFTDLIMTSILFATYYFLLEFGTGRTLGKLITGTIVVTSNGKKPTAIQIFKRSITRILRIEAFSFLGDGIGWHDSWSDTIVVKKKEFQYYMDQSNSIDEIGKEVSFDE